MYGPTANGCHYVKDGSRSEKPGYPKEVARGPAASDKAEMSVPVLKAPMKNAGLKIKIVLDCLLFLTPSHRFIV